MLRWVLLAAAVVAGTGTASQQTGTAPQQPHRTAQCRPEGPLARIPDLAEGSGVTTGIRNPGRVWAVNDSGEAAVLSIDRRGFVTGRVRLDGAKVEDWEAIALGPCQATTCLYIGDIGDNDARRDRITVYQVPELVDTMTSVRVTGVVHARYPDGPHDAETLLVTPDGGMFVVTKGEKGPVRLYRFPAEIATGSTVTLIPVGTPRDDFPGEQVTDGAVSPNGAWIVLRSKDALTFYATAQVMAGEWKDGRRADLADLREPQGEGVAFEDATTLVVVGEGGGKGQPGTFARLVCQW